MTTVTKAFGKSAKGKATKKEMKEGFVCVCVHEEGSGMWCSTYRMNDVEVDETVGRVDDVTTLYAIVDQSVSLSAPSMTLQSSSSSSSASTTFTDPPHTYPPSQFANSLHRATFEPVPPSPMQSLRNDSAAAEEADQ